MKSFYTPLYVAFACVMCLHATLSWSQSNRMLMFSYFKGNGEDGLHLAYSMDGLEWTALKHDSSFLKPMVGKEKLMRDPCIIRGMDGYFHMVWTASGSFILISIHNIKWGLYNPQILNNGQTFLNR